MRRSASRIWKEEYESNKCWFTYYINVVERERDEKKKKNMESKIGTFFV
jgi:hypothetical protein